MCLRRLDAPPGPNSCGLSVPRAKKTTSTILQSYDDPIRSAYQAKYVTKTLTRFDPLHRGCAGRGPDGRRATGIPSRRRPCLMTAAVWPSSHRAACNRRYHRSRPARSPRRGAPAVLRPGHGSALLVHRRVCPRRGLARSESLRDDRIHTQDYSRRVLIQHVLHVRRGLVAHLPRQAFERGELLRRGIDGVGKHVSRAGRSGRIRQLACLCGTQRSSDAPGDPPSPAAGSSETSASTGCFSTSW